MNEAAFYALAAVMLGASSGVILLRNPVHCALSLVVALFAVAVAYVSLQAHLVAALQIIVYAGAVMVLFLFVIMLLNLQSDPKEPRRTSAGLAAAVAAAAFAFPVMLVVREWAGASGEPAVVGEAFGTTRALASVLFTDYVVAFELTSLLLLVAIVGAVVIARRDAE